MDLKSAAAVLTRRLNHVQKQIDEKADSKAGMWHAKNETKAGKVITNIVNAFIDWNGEEKRTIEIDGQKFEIKPAEISSFSEAFNDVHVKEE